MIRVRRNEWYSKHFYALFLISNFKNRQTVKSKFTKTKGIILMLFYRSKFRWISPLTEILFGYAGNGYSLGGM